MNRAIIFGLGVLFASAAAAQQYKWTDQNGKTQYGDVPPPGVKAQRLKPPPGPAPAPSAAGKKDEKGAAKPLSPEAAYRKRQEEAQKENEKATQAEQEAAAKRENCQRSQEALRTFEAGGRISRTDAKGERYFLDDAQVAQEMAPTRQIVQQSCN